MHQDLDTRRKAFKNAENEVDRIGAYYLLVDHSQMTWNDLLDGLSEMYHEFVVNHARGSLHAALRIYQTADGQQIKDPAVWRQIIEERGLQLDTPVRQRRA